MLFFIKNHIGLAMVLMVLFVITTAYILHRGSSFWLLGLVLGINKYLNQSCFEFAKDIAGSVY